MSDHPPVPRAPSRPARALLVAALAVSALIAGLGWVFASSPGSAPDDDYHLVSTWCPRPIASSGCETTTIDGDVYVMAPVTTSHAQCEAFSPDKSHACIDDYSDSMMFPSYRYNDGAYPYGFYQFHHLLAGDSVEASAWHMRVVNVLIALALLGGVCALAPASMRQGLFLAITLAWIPMGAYFIASNNPSSWAITGVFAYGAGLFGALRSDGRRRWALLGIALVGALLCFGSRGDAAFYVFVVSLGVLIAVGRRDRIVEIAGASVLSAIGVWLMAGGGQASTIASSSATVSLSERLAVAISNIRYLPEYFAGFAGLYSGPGWRDTPLPGACVVLGLMLLGVGVLIGGHAMTWRKAASVVVVLGAMAGIPILIATPPTFPNLGGYHSRYALPLLGVWLLLWLAIGRGQQRFSRTHLVLFVVATGVVNASALHTTIARYTNGLIHDALTGWLAPANLNRKVEWWWAGMPLSPMALWALASAAYVAAVVIALRLLAAGPAPAPSAVSAAQPAGSGDGAGAEGAATRDETSPAAPSPASDAPSSAPSPTQEPTHE
ncbi:membrane protein, PF09913 family [Schaalia georgiae F0490]|uniref:Membrane protein, PF09913 family n=1 Tax=Schaalia georgiae F0490 TaxID=1125717 RepID=J0WLF5_9ACTO|nr:DUF2142 domain-containing protein [Schaalia georgiae]EJF37346.1 membrane protein, PF09913 family [Schaalia georgiae F0490]